jgi:putative hydrolase of the HAD superfamily
MPITTLFLDVGGVLLTNGWDHHARRRVAKHFNLPWAEMEDRHGLMFETHEEGKLTFDEYLVRLVFYRKRRSRGLSSGASCSSNQDRTPR